MVFSSHLVYTTLLRGIMKNTVERILHSKALLAFLLGFVMYYAVMLPDLIQNGGVTYAGTGDYNNQVLPFAYHVRQLLLSGEAFGWDWSSGIGSSALTSYAFYNLFSPFTLLYLLIPHSLMGQGITLAAAVKFGTGAMLAYLYIKRYVTNPHYAVIGGMLYAFSSFSAYNLVFHFTDSIMLFPLILIGMDTLCLDNRRGVFALSVALLAFTNYYFFFGQAVFCVIYFLLRCADREDLFSLKKLLSVAAEALLGCGAAMVVLLPCLLAIMSSSKATGVIQPQSMLLYKDIFDYLKIIQSAFMVPDPFSFVSLFPENETVYPWGNLIASVAAYIPLFSAAGVISYLLRRKKAWQSLLIITCTVMAMVPVLNSVFSMLNSSYYARWYYMPLLIGVMMSVKAVEDKLSFRVGIIASSAVLAGLLICQLFISTDWVMRKSVSNATASLPQNLILFGVTAISLAMLIIIVCSKRDKEFIPKLYILAAVGCYCVFGVMAQYFTVGSIGSDKSVLAKGMALTEQLPDNVEDERIVLKWGSMNYNLIWDVDSVTSFNSLYDNGYIQFADSIGLHGAAGIYYPIVTDYSEICDLLSVKYYFVGDSGFAEKSSSTPIGSFGGYYIYENDNYIPMGFTYDSMISSAAFNGIEDAQQRREIYLRSLVTDTPQLFEDILPTAEENASAPLTEEEYAALVERHRSEACSSVEKSSRGLTAEIQLSRENVVFFSASFNDGWRAYVDGVECEVYNVNNGMIGVRVPEGSHSIELRYRTEGAAAGAVISVVSLLALAVYVAAMRLHYSRGITKQNKF